MAGATRTTMNDALKRLYLPRLRSIINESTVLANRLQKNTTSTSVSGREAVVPVNIDGTIGYGARGDGDDLPTPENQTFVETTVPYKYLYGRIRVTHPTIVSSKDNEGSWVKAVSAEMDGLTRDIKQDVNRQYFGAGDAVLGRAAAGASAATVSFDTPHRLKVGMVVQFFSSGGTGTANYGSDTGYDQTFTLRTQDGDSSATSSHLTVATIPTATTATFTNTNTGAAADCDASGGNHYEITDGDLCIRVGSRAILSNNTTVSTSHEMEGLLSITDAGAVNGMATKRYATSFQGINRDTYPKWEGNIIDAGGTLDASDLDNGILQIEERGEGSLTMGITSRQVYSKIAGLMTADRRYGETQEFEGGFKAIAWGGIPIFWDKDCPSEQEYATVNKHQLFLLDENEIQRYQLEDWNWDDTDGNVLHRNEGKASYDATLYYYGNLGCMAPDRQGKLTNITV